MNSYVIIATPGSTLTEKTVRDVFPDLIDIVPGVSWAIGTSTGTCADVRNLLGADPKLPDPKPSCVVLRVSEYNGYAKRELWDKFALWERT